MEDYNVSKRVDVTNQEPAASWSRMAARPANWPGPLYRHDGCIVRDRQPQLVPDSHPDWELPGAAHASHLANGRAAVGRSCWHGICSPGKHWLCLYGIAAQPWFCQRLDCSDSDPGPICTVWPRGLDGHSWRRVVP